jgi:hypothetical protein
MTTEENKLSILKKVEDGTLTIEEGADLLAILERGQGTAAPQEPLTGEVIDPVKEDPIPDQVPAGWRAAWSFFIWLGVVFMGASGYWLWSSYARSGLGVGFWFALVFLILSSAIVFFGWRLVAGRWMAVRIVSRDEGKPSRHLFWAPLPLHLGIWVFKTFDKYMPEDVKEQQYDQMLVEMDKSLNKDEVFKIDIDSEGKTEFNLHTEGKDKKFKIHAEFD